MSESETLQLILAELKKINTELQNTHATIESNQELLMNSMSVIQTLLDKIRIEVG